MYRKAFLGILLISAIGSEAFAAGKCSDISTVWTLNSVYVDQSTPTRIYADNSTYADGSRGVSALIKCGTDDAVLIVNSPRQVMFNFGGTNPSPFLGTDYSQPPTWTNGPAFGSTPSTVKNCGGSPCTVLNIRDILGSSLPPLQVDRTTKFTLYTKLVSGFVAPDKQKYSLRMENPATSNVALDPNDPTANSPYLEARVQVDHWPAGMQNPTGNQKETWFVYPEQPPSSGAQTENSTLFSDGATVNYGQFSMPFYFIIQAQ